MTRRAMLLRSWGLVLALIALSAAFAPKANAQGPYPCKCDFGTIYGSDDLKCKVEVCVKTSVSWDCFTIGPGSVEFFKCIDYAAIYIVDCKGVYHEVTEKCTECICITPDCFVQACLGYDDNGCLVVKVFPC